MWRAFLPNLQGLFIADSVVLEGFYVYGGICRTVPENYPPPQPRNVSGTIE